MIPVEENTKKLTEDLRYLIDLQGLDTRIFRLKEEKAEIPRKIASLQSSLDKEKHTLEEIRLEYDKFKKLRKDKEMKLDEDLEKMKKLKSRTSEIKTNKEYQAHLKEIETAQNENKNIEDEILNLMERIEETVKLLETEGKAYDEIVKRYENDKEIYKEDEKRIDGELSNLLGEREKLVSAIRPDLYDSYSTVLKKGKGMAVVPIRDGSCTGCHMSLPPQLVNDVRKNEEIIDCSNCHRILYYEGIEKP